MYPSLKKCDKCGGDAVIFQKYSGMHLCSRHLVDDVERKIKRALRKSGAISSGGGHILVALSGGKDSVATLHVLKKVLGDRHDLTLSAVTVDEGIAGYREHTIKIAREAASGMGVQHRIVSFRDAFGVTLDEIAAEGFAQSPCTFCGVLRKALINNVASDMGADQVATGHNLDDESQTVLMNYLNSGMCL